LSLSSLGSPSTWTLEATSILSECSERNNGYLERYGRTREAVKRERLGRSRILDGFIRDIKERPSVLKELDEALWLAVVDQVAICRGVGCGGD